MLGGNRSRSSPPECIVLIFKFVSRTILPEQNFLSGLKQIEIQILSYSILLYNF